MMLCIEINPLKRNAVAASHSPPSNFKPLTIDNGLGINNDPRGMEWTTTPAVYEMNALRETPIIRITPA
jgi:hypothetical protein